MRSSAKFCAPGRVDRCSCHTSTDGRAWSDAKVCGAPPLVAPLLNSATRGRNAANVAGAQQALVEARTVDPDRFRTEGLAAVLEKLQPPPADPTRAALQQGLLALLKGRAAESIAILEPAASRPGKAASLHAYLGVAYATQALSAPKSEDSTRLKNKAIEQFKVAKSVEPDYQLSNRIVSPAILSIYQQVNR